MLTKFKLLQVNILCLLVLVGNAIGSPLEISVEYAPSGSKEIVLSVKNSTGIALPVELTKIGGGFRVFVTQETGVTEVIPSLEVQINDGTMSWLWESNSETISSFPAFHFEKINIGTHRLSVFWNARKSQCR